VTTRLSAAELNTQLTQLMPAHHDNDQRRLKLARLLATCGWTQHELAEHMNRTQAWVSQNMSFGRFFEWQAENITQVIPAGTEDIGVINGHTGPTIRLTESEFRRLWKRPVGRPP
jgi:hypothetical protein